MFGNSSKRRSAKNAKESGSKRRHKGSDRVSAKSHRKRASAKAPVVEIVRRTRVSSSAFVEKLKEQPNTLLVSEPLPPSPKAVEAEYDDSSPEKEIVELPPNINSGDTVSISQQSPVLQPLDETSNNAKFVSRTLKTRFSVGSKFPNSLEQIAKRTMYALVSERDRDITRHIVLGSEADTARASHLYPNYGGNIKRSRAEVLCWPNVHFYKYLNSGSMDDYKPFDKTMLQDHWPNHVPISLEEPGMEWDMRELAMQADDSAHEQTFNDDISDPSVNGGISLLIRRNQGSDDSPTAYTTGGVEYLTKQHLIHPKLQAPRYSRVPLADQFRCNSQTPVVTKHHQPLVDMTRAQVLNQIINQNSQCTDKPSLPLSKFVSCTIAEEAVSGILQTWSNTSEYCNSVGSISKDVFPGMAATQWVAVLQSALVAGIPPEVVARAYYRLEKLCDILVGNEGTKAKTRIMASTYLSYRRYPPKQDDNETYS
ncbi:hypothetical protein COEREDRAFT_6324 [Coemansia reversa NRRL 1564]|uniref:Uncharacterized protein n=1 Tax=Coemansia reversa (strain ATCC 12441 / NRRL 1564) TaxID=763665 RepID=A0A2G5BHX0_COERN|nr:hypothetical protein COEREDRAFT_6324 [Coemansia reversa NRRL 1564]|eukprot:PIA18616.1 hypothetical protein COEREDRAFT_6324 [Coemansia reversa NRRL 1564]